MNDYYSKLMWQCHEIFWNIFSYKSSPRTLFHNFCIPSHSLPGVFLPLSNLSMIFHLCQFMAMGRTNIKSYYIMHLWERIACTFKYNVLYTVEKEVSCVILTEPGLIYPQWGDTVTPVKVVMTMFSRKCNSNFFVAKLQDFFLLSHFRRNRKLFSRTWKN